MKSDTKVLKRVVQLLLLFGLLVNGVVAFGAKKKSEAGSVIEFPFVPLPGAKIYADKSRSPEERAAAVLAEMTIKEKLSSVAGFKHFYSPQIERLGIRPLYFSDASQGVHIREEFNTGLDQSTAFPCTLALAATWDPGLANQFARAIGEQCRAGDIAVLLGPGMNLYRSSRCGRNFEYLGEDPFLAGQLVASYVAGMQSSGTMATLKHFLGNNSETLRKTSDSVMSERALHELYTPAFKAGIGAGAGAVMTSYNLVNGEWVGHSRTLVDELLRKEFGFQGLVMSDWHGVHNTEKFMHCEMDLLMPGVRNGELEKLFADKKFSEKDLDGKILRWLTAFFKMGFYDRPQKDPSMLAKFPEHEAIAMRAARESIVLLSNPKSILPLNPAAYKKILVVGDAAKHSIGGGGSGAVKGYSRVSFWDALRKEFGDRVTHISEPGEIEVRSADLVIVAVATSDAENRDRTFELGKGGAGVAAKCAALNPNTILISQVGGGYAMADCYDKVAAHLFALFLGQVQGTAIVDVLMGRANPSGKLPFTIEKQFSDSPASVYPAVEMGESFPDAGKSKCARVEYKEDVFMGYRWYEAKKIAPLYPFGFGLSYTAFKYDALKLSAKTISGTDALKVSFTVANIGKVAGAEIAQLYVQDTHSRVARPVKELKGFKKVMLQPGETSQIELSIDRKDLSYWDESGHGWKAEPGTFAILIGSSSADIRLQGVFELVK
jgi:beta-glucosidase